MVKEKIDELSVKVIFSFNNNELKIFLVEDYYYNEYQFVVK